VRQFFYLFTLIALFIQLTSTAQSNLQQDQRVDPLLKQVAAKYPGLKMFGRRDGSGRYVNMSVLNERTRQLKWFTCYGSLFDSIQLNEDAYNRVTSGELDPFVFYQHYSYEQLFYIEQAETLYRLNGDTALRDTSHNNQEVFNTASVRSGHTILQKLIAMEGLMKRICLQLRLFNSRTPRSLMARKNNAPTQQGGAGIITRNNDSVEYHNVNPLMTAATIVFCGQSPGKFFVYNHERALIDSVPLKPGKYFSLLKEKEDVFLLYRGWLELQWQQLADKKRQYARWLTKPDSGLYLQTNWKERELQLQNIAISLQDQQSLIEDKIANLIVPGEKLVEQLLANIYADEPSELSYLPGLGFAYVIFYERGHKQYELSDHRSNIMTVVSDKKKGIDGNTDGVIEYYNADIVNANDYYPFGSQMPGRTFSAERAYRYGYNGKENDNDIKGEGNQQDYGMRIYDPRLGRFLSVDPITFNYPELTPYQFASNTPVMGVDLDGKELEWFLIPLIKDKINGTEHFKRRNEAIVKRAVDTYNETVHGIPHILERVFPDHKLATIDPGIASNPMDKELRRLKNEVANTKEMLGEFKDLIAESAKGDDEAIGKLTFEAALFAMPGGEEIRTAGKIGEISYVGRMVRNSAGEVVERRFVKSVGDLDALAKSFEADLKEVIENKVKPESGDRWVTGINSKGETVRMEYSGGHASTGEPAHVQFEKYNPNSGKKGRFQTEAKYFYDLEEYLKP